MLTKNRASFRGRRHFCSGLRNNHNCPTSVGRPNWLRFPTRYWIWLRLIWRQWMSGYWWIPTPRRKSDSRRSPNWKCRLSRWLTRRLLGRIDRAAADHRRIARRQLDRWSWPWPGWPPDPGRLLSRRLSRWHNRATPNLGEGNFSGENCVKRWHRLGLLSEGICLCFVSLVVKCRGQRKLALAPLMSARAAERAALCKTEVPQLRYWALTKNRIPNQKAKQASR